MKNFFAKHNIKTISTKDVENYIYNKKPEPIIKKEEKTQVVNQYINEDKINGKGVKNYFLQKGDLNEKEKAHNHILGKTNYKDLEIKYKKIEEECSKWQGLAQRYYDEKFFLSDKLLGKKNKISSKILNYKIIEYIKLLKLPGFISLILLLNIILLLFISINILKENNITVGYIQNIEQKEANVLPYIVLIGVYKNFDDAQKIVNDLRGKGFKAGISKPLNSKSNFYRVYIGHFETISKAESVLKVVKKKTSFKNSYVKKKF